MDCHPLKKFSPVIKPDADRGICIIILSLDTGDRVLRSRVLNEFALEGIELGFGKDEPANTPKGCKGPPGALP
jgi:hypothetical protein